MQWLAAFIIPIVSPCVVDEYDSIIWNQYKNGGRYHTQLLVATYTRVGVRYEDWRTPKTQPVVRRTSRGVVVRFYDDRDRVFREIHARSYFVVKSDYDLELRNREKIPRDHRRPLSTR